MTQTTKSDGYYAVLVENMTRKVPYIVFARSDYHAARIVKSETGYMAQPRDIQGPF
jgi:hypothetical protein